MILGLILLFLGCSDSSMTTQTQFDSSINGKTIAYPLNQTFSLALDVEADAGYQWDHNFSDTTVVHLDSTKFQPTYIGPITPGGGVRETLYFRTTKLGKCSVNLIEHRGWMPNVPPIHSVRFIVLV